MLVLLSRLLGKKTFFIAVLLYVTLWTMLHTLIANLDIETLIIPRYTINTTKMNPIFRDKRLSNGTVTSTSPPVVPRVEKPTVSSQTRDVTDFTCTKVSNSTLKTTDTKWRGVSSSRELFVFSAYFHRGKQVLEIVAIAKLKTKVKAKCAFMASGIGTKRVVSGKLFMLPEHHERLYGSAVLTCPVGPNVPQLRFVTIIIVANKKIEQASVPVHYPESPHPTVNVTVCYPALHSNYLDAHELIQNIAANSLFGAAKFFIYDHSIHPNLTKALNVIVNSGLLELVSWKVPVSQIHYYGQIAAAQDCLYRNRYSSRFIVFQDLDEFIVPTRPESWIEMMSQISRHNPKAGTFVVRHTFFPKEWPDRATNSEYDEEIRQNKLYVLYKTTRLNLISGYNDRSKLIVIPTRVKYMGIHHVPYHMDGYRGALVSVKDALLHHYRYIKNAKGLPRGIPKRINSTAMKPYTRELVELSSNIWSCVEER